VRTLSSRANEKGLELALEVKPEVPDALVGDPGRLAQILMNLVRQRHQIYGKWRSGGRGVRGTCARYEKAYSTSPFAIPRCIAADKQKIHLRGLQPRRRLDLATIRRDPAWA